MRIIDQIKRDIDKTKGVTLMSACNKAKINYQTVWKAAKKGTDIKESTLIKLSKAINKKIILIDNEI